MGSVRVFFNPLFCSQMFVHSLVKKTTHIGKLERLGLQQICNRVQVLQTSKEHVDFTILRRRETNSIDAFHIQLDETCMKLIISSMSLERWTTSCCITIILFEMFQLKKFYSWNETWQNNHDLVDGVNSRLVHWENIFHGEVESMTIIIEEWLIG